MSLGTPAFCLGLTVGAYFLATALYERARRTPLLNPTAIAILILCLVLPASRIPYATYFTGAAAIHFLLGPTTVALGLALHRQLPRIRTMAPALLGALAIGSLCGILSALLLAKALGADRALLISLAPKSVTTPIAMGISETLGGQPSLTAVVVLLTGLWGALVGLPLLSALGFTDPEARGFALGLSAHGLGTASAFEENPTCGAFAGLAMGLNGLLTALVTPIVLALFR